MDFIKRILLILILVLTIFSCAQIEAKEYILSVNTPSISAYKTNENEFIKNRENIYCLSAISNSTSQIASRRNNDNQNGTLDGNNIVISKQFNNLIEYIYNQAYLEDKNELALFLLFHQIQPNAP